MARAKKTNNKRRNLIISSASLLVAFLVLTVWYLHHASIPVLEPAGPVAAGERHLLIIAVLLMLIVVVPVFVLTFAIVWRYRESNHNNSSYKPNWDHSRVAETIWWLIPSALIAVLAVITWRGTYQYDPYKPLASPNKPMTIQVVALDWRWLFIYPDQHVASINDVYFPANTPVTFQITADAPMNSFWIPQLGGQIYAMPGMNTQLNLMASRNGTYIGRSANISGKGFAGMQIMAHAVTKANFKAWVTRAEAMPQLTGYAYDDVATPNTDTTPYTYSRPMTGLYQDILNKYMENKTTIAEEINYDSAKDLESM